MEEKISIQKENVLNAYKHASEEQKALLENMFGKDMFKPKNIMERVKTFEDACNELGEDNVLVQAYRTAEFNTSGNQNDVTDVVAYLKLRIICAALNDGWKPTFHDGECRYYPWFYIYTKEEYEELDEDEKKECHFYSRSHDDMYESGTVVCSYKGVWQLLSGTFSSSLLVFKTRELAEYCEKQFIDIWDDYLF